MNSVERDYTCSSAIVYSDISDHLPVALHLKRNSIKSYKIGNYASKRYFDSGSIDKFNTELANMDWNALYNSIERREDCNIAFSKLSLMYNKAFDNYFPEKLVKLSNRMTPRHDWMTKGLMKSCIKKSKLYRKCCTNRTN